MTNRCKIRNVERNHLRQEDFNPIAKSVGKTLNNLEPNSILSPVANAAAPKRHTLYPVVEGI